MIHHPSATSESRWRPSQNRIPENKKEKKTEIKIRAGHWCAIWWWRGRCRSWSLCWVWRFKGPLSTRLCPTCRWQTASTRRRCWIRPICSKSAAVLRRTRLARRFQWQHRSAIGSVCFIFFPTKSGAFNSPTKLAHPSKWLDCHSQKSSSNPSQAVEWRFFCGQHRVCWGKFHSRTKNRKRNSDCVEMNSGDASFPEDHKRKKKETHRRTSTFFLHQYHVAGSYCRPQKYSNYIHIDSCGGWEQRRDVSNGHKFTNENKESKVRVRRQQSTELGWFVWRRIPLDNWASRKSFSTVSHWVAVVEWIGSRLGVAIQVKRTREMQLVTWHDRYRFDFASFAIDKCRIVSIPPPPPSIQWNFRFARTSVLYRPDSIRYLWTDRRVGQTWGTKFSSAIHSPSNSRFWFYQMFCECTSRAVRRRISSSEIDEKLESSDDWTRNLVVKKWIRGCHSASSNDVQEGLLRDFLAIEDGRSDNVGRTSASQSLAHIDGNAFAPYFMRNDQRLELRVLSICSIEIRPFE